MILTDRFVFIHMPKTGGTFVTRALQRLHGGWRTIPRPRTRYGPLVLMDKHGTCRDIPASHRNLPIVSALRNPFDRYVSQYEYGWWRRHVEGVPIERLRALQPTYPDLSFAEFVELATEHFTTLVSPLPPGDRPGFHTEQLCRFYFRDPQEAFARMDEVYIASGAYQEDMFPVEYLRTENLTEDLCGFLERAGYQRKDIAAVRRMRPVYPPRVRRSPLDHLLRYRPRRRGAEWQGRYTPQLRELVRHRERFLLCLFPDLDVAGYGPTSVG